MRVSLRVLICQLCSRSLHTEQGKLQASLVAQTVKSLPANAGDLGSILHMHTCSGAHAHSCTHLSLPWDQAA